MYPFLTLEDKTEIVHSEILPDDKVKVYVEKPDEKDCFHSFLCILPDCEIKDVEGFSKEEINHYVNIIYSNSSTIIKNAFGNPIDNTMKLEALILLTELNAGVNLAEEKGWIDENSFKSHIQNIRRR